METIQNYRDFTDAEKKWLTSFEKVMKKAPASLFMFVGEGICVYATDENNKRYIVKGTGCIDGNATGVSIRTNIQYDGGGY